MHINLLMMLIAHNSLQNYYFFLNYANNSHFFCKKI